MTSFNVRTHHSVSLHAISLSRRRRMSHFACTDAGDIRESAWVKRCNESTTLNSYLFCHTDECCRFSLGWQDHANSWQTASLKSNITLKSLHSEK